MPKAKQVYKGFEQGPIRPPSEANSLLIRVTRNCPWNFCTFCPVYKRRKFSIRPVDHVKADIDMVHKYVTLIQEETQDRRISPAIVKGLAGHIKPGEDSAYYAALQWISNGCRSIFIQDANSLVIKPDQLIDILSHLKKRFPTVERITSYARSHTVSRIPDDKLSAMRAAGLTRIHIGMESGADAVLKQVRKGTTQAQQIEGGLKVKKAGMELSEYVMPGLGGQSLSRIHALETADALNAINPDFIRLRTLAIPNHIPLAESYRSGVFKKCTDRMMAEEIHLFIGHLNGITSTLKSDHILNLFQEVEGTFPDDKQAMIDILKTFMDMDAEDQCRYQVGRRLGMFRVLADMASPHRLKKVESVCKENGITPDNVDEAVDELMKRFI